MKGEVELLFLPFLCCDYWLWSWLPTASPLLQDSNTPLHLASARGHLEVIKVLMSHAAYIHLRNKVGVTIAISDTVYVCVFSTVVLYFVVNGYGI